jgi:hypothetical protein
MVNVYGHSWARPEVVANLRQQSQYNPAIITAALLASLRPITFRGCSNCGVREDGRKLKKCGRCKRSHYCSRDCQAEHWAKHKTVCAREAANQKNIAGCVHLSFFNQVCVPSCHSMSSLLLSLNYALPR